MAESFDLDYDAVGATAASGGVKKPAVKRKLRKAGAEGGNRGAARPVRGLDHRFCTPWLPSETL